MAIVPLLVVIVQLGTYLSLNTDIVKYLITAYAPQEVQQLLLYLFNTSSTIQSGTLFVIFTALSFFWLISKGFYGIANAANTTYQVPLMKFAYLERIFTFLMLCFMMLLLVSSYYFCLFWTSVYLFIIKSLSYYS